MTGGTQPLIDLARLESEPESNVQERRWRHRTAWPIAPPFVISSPARNNNESRQNSRQSGVPLVPSLPLVRLVRTLRLE